MTTCGESFAVLGVSHKTAPIEIREKLALGQPEIEPAYQAILATPSIRECVVLNTCNRLEFYAVGCDPNLQSKLENAVAAFLEPSEWREHAFFLHNEGAVGHLFAVAAGLDSQMIGETEIFGQVKKSYADAVSRTAAGPWTHALFQAAFRAGKWARTHTAIGRGRVTEAGVALELGRRIFGSLTRCRILVLGTGEVAQRTLEAFAGKLRTPPVIAGRNADKTQELATRFGGTTASLESAVSDPGAFDIVICSTSAPGMLITASAVRDAMARRGGEPIFFIDLAVPRDVEPSVSQIDNAFVYNLDDLAEIANENLSARKQEISRCSESLREQASAAWSSVVEGVVPRCKKFGIPCEFLRLAPTRNGA